MGSDRGLCEICRDVGATATCRTCGRRVCARHYERGRGLCIVCTASLCAICGKRLSIARCQVCLRLVCAKCSMQVDPVRRVCLDCYRSGRRAGEPPIEVYSMRKLASRIIRLEK